MVALGNFYGLFAHKARLDHGRSASALPAGEVFPPQLHITRESRRLFYEMFLICHIFIVLCDSSLYHSRLFSQKH